MNAEEKKRYFTETDLVLNREGFHAETILGGTLGVWLDDEPLCEVSEVGGITYRGDNISSADVLQMNRYITYKTSILGKGDAQEQAERFEAGNITAIKNTDTIIDGSDVLQVNRYIAGKSSMFDAVE